MCADDPELQRQRETAHIELAHMIEDDLHTRIDPRELRVFIQNNWDRIARYAHLIHGAPR